MKITIVKKLLGVSLLCFTLLSCGGDDESNPMAVKNNSIDSSVFWDTINGEWISEDSNGRCIFVADAPSDRSVVGYDLFYFPKNSQIFYQAGNTCFGNKQGNQVNRNTPSVTDIILKGNIPDIIKEYLNNKNEVEVVSPNLIRIGGREFKRASQIDISKIKGTWTEMHNADFTYVSEVSSYEFMDDNKGLYFWRNNGVINQVELCYSTTESLDDISSTWIYHPNLSYVSISYVSGTGIAGEEIVSFLTNDIMIRGIYGSALYLKK